MSHSAQYFAGKWATLEVAKVCPIGHSKVHQIASSNSSERPKIMTPKAKQNIEGIFESAVRASWGDLMPGSQSGLVHVEYGYSPRGSIDLLQIWSSTRRGHWRLACEYCSTASLQHDRGMRFESGIRSDELRDALELVLQHQDWFEVPANLGRRGLLQVTQPTTDESVAASASVREVYEQLASLTVLPV